MKSPYAPQLILIAVALTLAGCDIANALRPSPSGDRGQSFVTWHQGFEHGTSGWYDASTEGPLGWCGFIEAVNVRHRGRADLAPAAGRGYALVSAGPCNDYWPLPGGAPYAPGPDMILLSDSWPPAGYVTELDVYLSPSWSGDYQGNLSPNSIIQLGATVMNLDYQLGDFHPGPHWFATVDAVPGEEALTVFDYRIDKDGWYTFRFILSEQDGEVKAAFELRKRRGRLLTRVDAWEPAALQGPAKMPFTEDIPTAEYGSGHIWFFDIAGGLQVPIDEHRVRPGH